MRRIRWRKYILPAIVLLVLAVFVAYPTVRVLVKSLSVDGQTGIGNYVDAFTKPQFSETIWSSLAVATGAAILSTLLGLIIALTVFKTTLPFRRFFSFAAILPMIIPGFVSTLAYPRFYLDFETIGTAIPLWVGTRPYQALPFQWSCDIERAPGVVEHVEFLDLSGEPPMRDLAEHMIVALETTGPVLMYTTYERRVIQGLITMFPDLAEALQAIDARLVDLHPVTVINYYHPDMLGSWSIKAVLPTIASEMNYELLDGIQDGIAASNAYLEAVQPEISTQRKEEIRLNLLKYCKHDTEAMVRLVGFFRGA